MGDNENGERVQYPACAACKLQRKKCRENCVLRRPFPVEKSDEFNAVHKIFGVKNISHMLKAADSDPDKDEIAKSLVWEAQTWIEELVQGPFGRFRMLEERCERLERELDELREYKRKNQQVLQSRAISPMPGPEYINGFYPKTNAVLNGNNNTMEIRGNSMMGSSMNGYNGCLVQGIQERVGGSVLVSSFPPIGRMGTQAGLPTRFVPNHRIGNDGTDGNMFPYGSSLNRFDQGVGGAGQDYNQWTGGGAMMMKESQVACSSAPEPCRFKRKRGVNVRDASNISADQNQGGDISQDTNYINSNDHIITDLPGK